MATENHEDKTPLEKLGYATDDPSPRGIAITAAFLFGFVLFCTVLAAGLLAIPGILPHIPNPKTPFARQHPPAGEPVLQNNITATTDIRDLRQHEDAVLATYGKGQVGPSGPTFRIPIDKAIDIVSQDKDLSATQQWLSSSSNPVPGDLSKTQAGPKADVPSATVGTTPANSSAATPAPASSSASAGATKVKAPVHPTPKPKASGGAH